MLKNYLYALAILASVSTKGQDTTLAYQKTPELEPKVEVLETPQPPVSKFIRASDFPGYTFDLGEIVVFPDEVPKLELDLRNDTEKFLDRITNSVKRDDWYTLYDDDRLSSPHYYDDDYAKGVRNDAMRKMLHSGRSYLWHMVLNDNYVDKWRDEVRNFQKDHATLRVGEKSEPYLKLSPNIDQITVQTPFTRGEVGWLDTEFKGTIGENWRWTMSLDNYWDPEANAKLSRPIGNNATLSFGAHSDFEDSSIGVTLELKWKILDALNPSK